MSTTRHRLQPVYTPDDFAPLDYDEELTDVVFDEDDDARPASPDVPGDDALIDE